MAARTAKLHLTPGGYGGTVEVDGQRLTGIRNLTLTSGIGNIPVLTLELLMHEVEVDGELIVTVPDKTRDALVTLGWTPPSDSPGALS